MPFFFTIFVSSIHRRKKQWRIWNPKKIVTQNDKIFVQKQLFQKLGWFSLASIKSQAEWHYMTKLYDHYQYLRTKWPRTHVLQGMIVAFDFSVNFFDLTLTILKYDLRIHIVTLLDIPAFWVSMNSLCPAWPTRGPRTWKRCIVTFNLALTWHVILT